jgi:putative membrane protein
MFRPVLFVAVALTAAAPAAFAADPPSTAAAPGVVATSAMSSDEFLSKLAVGNKFEIDSSKLAISKTHSEQVKAFATQMVSDHGQAAVKMKQAVTDAKAKAPPESLDAKHQAALDDLKSKKDAAAFDKAYVDVQLQGHIDTVALVEAYAQNGDNPRLKAFASDLLPTLHSHLDQVKKLKSAMGMT